MSDAREQLRELFERTADNLPDFRNFLLHDCLPKQASGFFDVTDFSGKVPWLPYLEIASGNEHAENLGQFFYTRPAWNEGDDPNTKYRYLGKQAKFYLVGSAKYIVEYDKDTKKIVGRFLPMTYSAKPGSSLEIIKTVYLATEIQEAGYGIVALEGLGFFDLEGCWTALRIVRELIELLQDSTTPHIATLVAKKANVNMGVYFDFELHRVEKASWEDLPFKDIASFIREYYRLNTEIKLQLLNSQQSHLQSQLEMIEEIVIEEDEIDTTEDGDVLS